MIVAFDVSGLKRLHWYQLLLRFVLGGAVTVCAGLVSRHWGPLIGGLFLAFPAIFPATATLLEQTQAERKRRHGLHGRRSGRKAAALDAAGAVLGGFALAAFGAVAWLALPRVGAFWGLCLSGLAWLLVALTLWWLRRHV